MMEKKDIIKALRVNHIFSLLSAIIAIVVFETGILTEGALANAVSDTVVYVIQVSVVMATVLLVPLAIKGFTGSLNKKVGCSEEDYLKFFVKKSVQRIFILFIVLLLNIFVYYGVGYEGALYCGILALGSLIYSFPTLQVLNQYLEKNSEAASKK